MTHDHDEVGIVAAKMVALWVITLVAHNIDSILHTVLGILSIGYIAWKWRRDILKNRNENGQN